MARTAQLDLPLLMPSQAQKHVTVNEALARIDAAAQLRVVSASVGTPPASAAEGAGYLVPSAATGAWAGQGGRIAVWSNGGWTFLLPRAGWRAWNESSSGHLMFDGTGWIEDAIAVAPGGAAVAWTVREFDHPVTPGAANLTAVTIPGQAQLLGVTGRVIGALTGGLGSWRIGVSGSDNRYGSGLGTGLNSYLIGMSGSPVTYYAPTPLLLTAEGGSFGAGTIRLALHYVRLEPPPAV